MAADRQWQGGLTLRGLLLTFIGTLMLVLLAGSFYLGVERFRSYLAQQLLVHAQDAATALGLSLSNAVDGSDPVAAASVIDAVFDRGDYQAIVYRDVQGGVVVSREGQQDVPGVPRWFVSWAHLPVPMGEAEVVRGWQRLGTVAVTSDPGTALRDLWRSARDQLGWFALNGAVAVLVLLMGVHQLLRPLNALENQARAVQRRDFSARSPLPRTRELRGVTLAMNQMADDLGALFDHQVGLIEKLRQQSAQDALTGLANRAAFDQRLRAELESEDRVMAGVLVLLQLDRFADFNQRHGREAGDALLQGCAEDLSGWLLQFSGAFAGRRNGAEFALFLPGATTIDAQHACGELLGLIEARYQQTAPGDGVAVHAGLAIWHEGLQLRALLANADTALRQAQAAGVSGLCTHDESARVALGADRWRTLLEQALDDERLHMLFQPIYAGDGRRIVHWQVQSRLELDSEWVTASIFVPLVERFSMAARLDRLVIERALALLADRPSLRLSVSVAASSLADEHFAEALQALLLRYPQATRQLWLSLPEQAVRQHLEAVRRILLMAQGVGVRVAVDRFGVGGVQFGYLHELSLDAIRIDRSYIRDVEKHPDNRFFIQSILPIAHGRGMYVHATGVETAAEWAELQSLGVDGAMGYHLCRPIDEVPPAS